MTVKSAATLIQPNRDDRLRQALQARYERADRITSTRADLRVKLLRRDEIPANMVSVPGWTDGNVIYINDHVLQVSQMDDKALVAALGVNLHELAHVIETPNLKGWLAKEIQALGARYWHSFNILEDQRAESFFVARFSDAPKFYTPMVLRWLMNKDSMAGNFVLLYGRRYLPWDLIQHVRGQFAAPELLGDFEDIINEYRSMDVHRNEKTAKQLIVNFTDLLQQLSARVSDGDLNLSSGHEQDPYQAQNQESRPADSAPDADESRRLSEDVEQQQNPDTIEGALDTEDEDQSSDEGEEVPGEADGDESDGSDGNEAGEGESADSEGDSPDDGSDTSEGSADGSSDASESGDGDGGTESSEDAPDGATESTSDDAGSGGDGIGSADGESSEPPSIEDLDEYLRNALDKVLEDADVVDELEETRDDVQQSSRGVSKPQSPDFGGATRNSPLTLDKMAHVKATMKRLQDARVGAETVLKRQVRSGTLNPLALHKAQPGDLDVFDTWDAGLVGEEGEMDVAILCDVSGSMRDAINDAAFTLYAIKRAFEALGDSHVTVWTYSSQSRLLYDRDERVNNSYYKVPSAYGGTQPYSAIEDAFRVLGTTKSKLRLLIIITDGAWGSMEQNHDLIRQANAAGVVTVLVGLDSAVKSFGNHECKIARDLDKPSDLPEVAGDIAAAMVVQAEHNARR